MASIITWISEFGIPSGMDDILVAEIAETDPKGLPWGRVAQIAVCRLDQDSGLYETVLSETVDVDPRDIGKAGLDRLSSVYGVNPEELYLGESEATVVERARKVLVGAECISFDVGAVFGGYLCYEPWNMTREVTLLPSISRFLPAQAVPLEGEQTDPLRKAYDVLCAGDPAEVGEGKRACERAQMSASVLAALIRAGLF